MWKNRLIFAVILILSICFVYLNGGKLPYTIIYTVFAALLLSVGYAFILFITLEFSLELKKGDNTGELNSEEENDTVKGDVLKFTFTAYNKTHLFIPYLHVRFTKMYPILTGLKPSSSISLLPGAAGTKEYELPCRYRGYYEIGVEQVEIEDFLGIVRFRGKIPYPFRVKVYPRILQIDNFPMRADMTSESALASEKHGEDITVVSDIKKYIIGDSVRKIHWKLTAKHNELMIKNFQPTSDQRNVVLLDLSTSIYTQEIAAMVHDKLIEALVAVLWYGVANRIITSLTYYSSEAAGLVTINIRDMADFYAAYDFLAGVNFDRNEDFGELIKLFSNKSINRIKIFAFTATGNKDSLYAGIMSTRYLGNDITLAYASPDKDNSISDSIKEMLQENGVDVFLLDSETETASVLERRLRN